MNEHESGTVVGIAWYRPEQWGQLRNAVVDPEVLEDTHEEWLEIAQQTVLDLAREGMRAERIDVDVDELASWCRETGRALDGAARAQYATERLRQEHEPKGNHTV